MDGVLKYLMQNYHVLGTLLIVTIVAIKIFATTKQAKKAIREASVASKTDEILHRLEKIEQKLNVRDPAVPSGKADRGGANHDPGKSRPAPKPRTPGKEGGQGRGSQSGKSNPNRRSPRAPRVVKS